MLVFNPGYVVYTKILWFGQTPFSWGDKPVYRQPAVLCTWSSGFILYPVRTAFTHVGVCLISPHEQSGSREILGAHLLSTLVEEKRCTVLIDPTTDLHNLCVALDIRLQISFHEPCVWYSWHYLPTGNAFNSDNWIFRKIPSVKICGCAEHNAAICISLYQALLFLLASSIVGCILW